MTVSSSPFFKTGVIWRTMSKPTVAIARYIQTKLFLTYGALNFGKNLSTLMSVRTLKSKQFTDNIGFTRSFEKNEKYRSNLTSLNIDAEVRFVSNRSFFLDIQFKQFRNEAKHTSIISAQSGPVRQSINQSARIYSISLFKFVHSNYSNPSFSLCH
jgi:hypothetical protein